jgi:glycerol-3-phosphate acyltransferase PlsX
LRLPVIKKPFIMIDMGAIVDVKPGELLQFAQMARVYAKLLGENNPTVGLLSNGTEEAKGNGLLKEVYPQFKEKIPNFIGYIEGNNLFYPSADIVVCDGFVGNVVLKTSEGMVKYFFHLLKEEISVLGIEPSQMEVLFSKLAKKLDYQEYGSAVLLGVKGICLIAHGTSRAKAVKN